MLNASDPATEFVDFWNDVLAPKFIRFRHVLVDGLTLHSEAAFKSLALSAGDRIVDVGCGFGDTAIQMAQKVGDDGFVLGMDCCEAFLELARADAQEAGVKNVDFVVGDAQSFAWPEPYDFCFARFGAMFFENPVAGLRNMRQSLKPGGKTMLIVWRSIDDNPWFKIPKDIVLQYLPPPGDGAKTCGPGPFSMANQEVVTKQLEIAGYTDIGFERVDADVVVGRDVEDAIAFQLALGPAGEVYREAGDDAQAKDEMIRKTMREELSKHRRDDGIVMQSSSWIITATNPAE